MAPAVPTRPTLAKHFSKWIDNISPSSAAIGFALVGIGILIGASINFLPDFWTGTGSNLGVEFISIAITVIVIDRLNKREAQREKRAELIVDMGSQDNGTAIRAVELLRKYGWLEDGSLTNILLIKPNLQGANLLDANLQGAALWGANLQGAGLSRANLQNASLGDSNLQGTYLIKTDLGGTDLRLCDMWGARLSDANLQDAKLETAKYDETTLLPDDTRWTPETDMERFTNPGHPDFWRSDNPNSPAYRRKQG